MPNFFVRFKHGPNREMIGMVMTGSSGREIAYEIRQKYSNVDIESIKASGDGVGKRARRRPWER